MQMRRRRTGGTVLLCAVLSVSMVVAPVVPSRALPADLSVTGLRVDNAVEPLGIDDTHPGLSWQLRSPVNGERQAAYRILVASAPDRLVPGGADVWDTGKVASSASVGVSYDGTALQSMRRYYWTVQVWGTHGGPPSSALPSWWEMGL